MSAQINPKPSMFSLLSSSGAAGATTIRQAGQPRSINGGGGTFRPCNNCNCSPGLLSRQGRRSSILKRMSISRSSSSRSISSASNSVAGSPRRSSVRANTDSLYTIESSNVGEDSSTTIDCTTNLAADKEINTSMRLEKLRIEMKNCGLGLYIIPSEDAHQSEYTSSVDQRRDFISGFSGSAGIAIVTRDVTCMNEKPEGLSALATDGRYFTQAINELDFNWILLKQGVKGELTWQEWCLLNACQMSIDSGEEIKIGVDPTLITYNTILEFEKLINFEVSKFKKNGKNVKVSIVPVKENLIDKIWSNFEIKPIRDFNKISILDSKYTGETTQSKLKKLSKYFESYGSETLILNSLDQIAWLLNLRGEDIEYNPLFYSYLIVEGCDKLTLYSGLEDIDNELSEYLTSINCTLKNYDEIWFDIRKIAISLNSENLNVLLTNESSWKMINCIVAKNFEQIESPIIDLKEIKNEIELKNQILAQKKDGLALIQFFSWLEDKLINCDLISEFDAAEQLLEFRSKLENFKGLSFETISSSGSNAAIIHYAPTKTTSSIINPNKIYLCDSGAQFLEGTTDTTRTYHFGIPTQEEIDNYTLVLKGHIALSTLVFPEGYTGYQIDCLARQFLWSKGLDYAHGTGHGVDSYGPVHSMGVGIGIRPYTNKNVLMPGHLISNEPGYYKIDEYGIRIENMFYVKQSEKFKDVEFNGKKWLEMETVTLVPYCKKLINLKLLNDFEKNWINKYHKTCWDEYEDKLDKKGKVWNWLKKETKPL